MAADRRAYGGKYHASPGLKTKLHRVEAGPYAGAVVGVSSAEVGASAWLFDWVERGAPYKGETGGPQGFELLLLHPDGSLYVASDQIALSGPIESEFYAVGTGDDLAIGAMAMGASAEEAVRIASRFDPHTGPEVTAWRPVEHASDCALHNAPALPVGPCDCGAPVRTD